MEYKLSSFKFCQQVTRADKHYVIMKVNSIRSKCPSDATFTGDFQFNNNLFNGEIKVLFSRGTFVVKKSGVSVQELMDTIINGIEDQISAWKEVRFDQPETFINYSDFLSKRNATGS